ncbi:MAG: DNA polymerase II large subunit [Candidatus Thermoplasmatota archaeon]
MTNTIAASTEIKNYFEKLQNRIDEEYKIATEARKKGLDPEKKVEIPQALDLAARVEELVGPKGVAPEIREVTKKIGNREKVSLEIAKKIAGGNEDKFKSAEEALDQAVRTSLAILTEGVLVAPLEGIAAVKIGKNTDGTDYVDLHFSGPIRSAGGTGQAMSVLIADVVRRELNIDKYKPTKGEIERYKEEIPAYRSAQSLQYTPKADEIANIVKNCPVCINGEGTVQEEVTGYRDLPRVETNRLRGGACLVLAEGLCLKAPKILKHVNNLKLKEWGFLNSLITKNKKDDEIKEDKKPKILPSKKYIGEVIAGRPVFSHPSRKGGLRLRYGRARTAGLASTAINPATMYVVDEFIAVGTQIKTERPGKATIGTPCDTIEGPIVLLENRDLKQFKNPEKLKKTNIKKIIDLGEILVPFGEFAENNALLPEAAYSYEWWIQDLGEKLNIKPEKYSYEDIKNIDKKIQEIISDKLNKKINLKKPTVFQAFEISEKYNIPLHPYYNLFWHDIDSKKVIDLSNFILEKGQIDGNNKLILPDNKKIKDILVELCALHKHKNEKIKLKRYGYPLIRCCGLEIKEKKICKSPRYKIIEDKKDIDKNESISLVSGLAGIKIRKKSPYRIGSRMARPEKAAARQMRPPPHVLFPVGQYGGNQRLLGKAEQKGKIEVEIGTRICPKCKNETYSFFCECGTHTEITDRSRVKTYEINLANEMNKAKKGIKERKLPEKIKGVVGLLSKNKTPEPIEKGILRAKHDLSVFKDGTIRFDMTDAPLTHFRPREIDVSLKELKKLGYTKDIEGKKLVNQQQICELKVQDVIISKSCAKYFLRVARFIDDLLEKFYGMKKFYNIKSYKDLVGHLTVGLAPHTSGGALSRIIGFTDAQVCYAHPYYHATKRRNADGDEDGLMLLMDALLNFSHAYIPDKRGGKMDLPLILTTRIDPAEVDKEAHNLDTLARYPLEFYHATLNHEHPKKIESKMGLVSSRIGKEEQYEKMYFTHDTNNISMGPKMSRYKSLKSMMDKMNSQLDLAAKIRAVDTADVAYKVIQRHFLPDIIGNFRAFSKQSVRCPKCNKTYRRIPLKGVCPLCNGDLTLTIHENSVKKYLEISKEIAERYHISSYACQRINLLEKSINSLFTNDKVKKTKLSDFL